MLSPQCGIEDYGIHGQQPRGSLPPSATVGMSPYARPSRQQPSGLRSASSSKIDPSFKSKRYRDKLREQIKALENLLPIDKATLHRKLDSQTVFRLVISYFRTKVFFQGFSSVTSVENQATSTQNPVCRDAHTSHSGPIKREILTDSTCQDFCERSEVQLALEALDGFFLIVTSDGTILYSTENISSHLGFHQVDLVHRCLYGIVHPDDHHDLKGMLEQTLPPSSCQSRQQMEAAFNVGCSMEDQGIGEPRKISFLCRMKCFNGTNTGFVKMHCCGTMRSFPGAIKSSRTSCQVLFLAFRPFTSLAQDTDIDFKQNVFWSKHDMDLGIKLLDTRACDILGVDPCQLEGKSLYDLIHPHDVAAVYACHKTLLDTDEAYTMYFRLIKHGVSWMWLHTRAKVILKNSRKHSIVLTHCPVREIDSSYLHQEAKARARYGLDEYLKMKLASVSSNDGESSSPQQPDCNQTKRRWTSNDTYVVASQSPYKLKDDYSASLHSPHGACPSSYHQSSERHSPVYPSTYAPHRYQKAAQGAHQSSSEKSPREHEAPPMNVNFYDYAHTSEDFIQPPPLHPNPTPHPAFSMYQMVAHLPPEMYDADSYRKHALMLMDNHAQMGGPGMMPTYHHHPMSQYQLPLTPQTSPQSLYPQGHITTHYPDHIIGDHPSETLSPPPSPSQSYKTACMYSSNSHTDSYSKGPESIFQSDCCKAEHYSDHYASVVVNGAVQVKLVDSRHYPHPQFTNGYSHMYPHGQYTSDSSCIYENRYETDVELKPFQRMNVMSQYKNDTSHCNHATYMDRSTFSNVQENGYHSDLVFHDRERFLPCPMANTKNGCLAPKLPPGNEAQVVSPASSLPPIGSFLDFLNEEGEIPPVEENC